MNIKNEKQIRKKLEELPSFCKDFMKGMEHTTSSGTRMAYLYDLGVFFFYIQTMTSHYPEYSIWEYPLTLLDDVSISELEDFLSYVRYYEKNGIEYANTGCGISRKLACLRSLYQYFVRKQLVTRNTASLILMPKLHEKQIVKLDEDEIFDLLDVIEFGTGLSDLQLFYHEKTKYRDLAIATVFLGTGIRVSELVGLDISDVDLKHNAIMIHRKGGSEYRVYYADDVADILATYLSVRKDMECLQDSRNALFLSKVKGRISVRSVETLIAKYTKIATGRHITPHRLRATYGTSLYKKTQDLYLVADALGHKNINTTRKHYIDIEDDRRKRAAQVMSLR